ncbi:MAG: hypothetical protein ACRDYA_24795 [Egibacteraceae bacterium]
MLAACGQRDRHCGLTTDRISEYEREVRQPTRPSFGAGPGSGGLVGSLDGRIPLAVATNSRRALAGFALTSAGFDGRFQAVVCAEDVVMRLAYVPACC